MSIHIHTGPGHHDGVLLQQLQKHEVQHSYSKHFPNYKFEKYPVHFNQSNASTSALFNFISWLSYGLRTRIGFIDKRNLHQDIIFYAYDVITRNKLTSDIKIFYGWPQVSLECFTYVKKHNSIKVLDYPIAHISKWNTILEEESQLLGLKHLHSKLSNRMTNRMMREIDLADYIYVGSQFVKNSFVEQGFPSDKVIVNNYGIENLYSNQIHNYNSKDEFNIIFVGSVEIRKGVHYLLEAFERLQLAKCKLHIVGTLHQDFITFYEKYKTNNNIIWHGQMNKTQLAALYQTMDVLVMPSLLEGLSLTILEAMHAGLPVIASENSGAADVIEDNINGFIFPIRNIEALQDKIQYLYNNRHLAELFGKRCKLRALESCTSDAYGDRLIHFLNTLLAK